MMAVCGHLPTTIPGKIIDSTQPVIEMHPFPVIEKDGICYFKDIWHGTKLPVNMIYPLHRIKMKIISNGSHRWGRLQLPHDSIGILECLYSDWKVPSKDQAS